MVQVSHVDYVLETALYIEPNVPPYGDRDVYMERQDPAKLIFVGDDVWCPEAIEQEDVVAAIEFYKIKRAQYVRINSGRGPLEAIDSMIKDLQEVDERYAAETGRCPWSVDRSQSAKSGSSIEAFKFPVSSRWERPLCRRRSASRFRHGGIVASFQVQALECRLEAWIITHW